MSSGLLFFLNNLKNKIKKYLTLLLIKYQVKSSLT